MGVTFRFGTQPKFVYFGGRTIKDGEAIAIWNREGKHKQIIGPRRIHLFCSTIRFLSYHKAESHQYLCISHRDGQVEHIKGPASIYQNPAYHDHISVHDGIQLLSSKDCIIVNKLEKNNKLTDHGIIIGPSLFIPDPDDCIHQFSWSSCNNGNLLKDAYKFQVLRTSNISWTHELTIPTSDGYSLTIQLVIDYHIKSIEKCMEANDPISKMHHGLKADCQIIGKTINTEMYRSSLGTHTDHGYETNFTKTLTMLDTYSHFKTVVDNCGLEIDSLKVIGLSFCDSLQSYIAKEQEATANIASEYTEKEKRRQIRELEMEDKRKCIEEEAALRQIQITRNEQIDNDTQQMKQKALERDIFLEKKKMEAKKELLTIETEAILEFLKEMKNTGVDINKFMNTVGGIDVAKQVMMQSKKFQQIMKASEVIPTPLPTSIKKDIRPEI